VCDKKKLEKAVSTCIQLLAPCASVHTVVETFKESLMSTSQSQINVWGNGLAVRFTRPMAKAAGIKDGTPVRITVKPGRIVIEPHEEPTLESMLAAFDPVRHSGEVMAFAPVGVEVL
jgi:antitoxin MazE